jgi:hypothetical protein
MTKTLIPLPPSGNGTEVPEAYEFVKQYFVAPSDVDEEPMPVTVEETTKEDNQPAAISLAGEGLTSLPESATLSGQPSGERPDVSDSKTDTNNEENMAKVTLDFHFGPCIEGQPCRVSVTCPNATESNALWWRVDGLRAEPQLGRIPFVAPENPAQHAGFEVVFTPNVAGKGRLYANVPNLTEVNEREFEARPAPAVEMSEPQSAPTPATAQPAPPVQVEPNVWGWGKWLIALLAGLLVIMVGVGLWQKTHTPAPTSQEESDEPMGVMPKTKASTPEVTAAEPPALPPVQTPPPEAWICDRPGVDVIVAGSPEAGWNLQCGDTYWQCHPKPADQSLLPSDCWETGS